MAGSKELDLIIAQLTRHDNKIDRIADSVSTIGKHCSTLLERTGHLATRDELSTAIRTHSRECKESRAPKASETRARTKLWKALATLAAVVATAVGAYVGFSIQ